MSTGRCPGVFGCRQTSRTFSFVLLVGWGIFDAGERKEKKKKKKKTEKFWSMFVGVVGLSMEKLASREPLSDGA